jgi:hypothetical protein
MPGNAYKYKRTLMPEYETGTRVNIHTQGLVPIMEGKLGTILSYEPLGDRRIVVVNVDGEIFYGEIWDVKPVLETTK